MTVSADSGGVAAGRFTIPPGIPVGTKLVEFVGAGGSSGKATFVGRGEVTTEEMRMVQNVTHVTDVFTAIYDPLAETFTLDSPAMASGVDLWFVAKGTSGKMFVQIRETANGVPSGAVIASKILPTASLTLDGWFRIAWPPVRLEARVEYALVVGCDDAATSVAIAVLGQFDSAVQQWVTSQPYQVGVLLSSSNASTWTAHQDRDLAFNILVSPIASNSRTIALPDVAVTGVSELMVLAAIERPTADCDCVFVITLPDATVLVVSAGQRVVLPSDVTGVISWVAIMTGSATATPRLSKDLELVTATRDSPATYVSRVLPAGTGSKVSVYYEQSTPGSSSVLVEVTHDQVTWVTVPVTLGTQIGEGWVDIEAKLTPWDHATAQVRLTLTGGAQHRPEVRKLRVVVT
ncbi:MAG: hypothetical protein GC191_09300 [Azospirillum sp.]|nr:hypothetical protein [Azospirillum sp.]